MLANSPDSVDAPFAPPRNGSGLGRAALLSAPVARLLDVLRRCAGRSDVRSPPNLERRLGSWALRGRTGHPRAPRGSGPVAGWGQLETLELEGGGDRAPDEAVEAEGSGLLPLAGRDHHLGFLPFF